MLNSITQTNICMISVVSQKFYNLIKIPGQGLKKWRCHSELIEVCVWWEKRGGGKKKISPLKNTNWKKISTKKPGISFVIDCLNAVVCNIKFYEVLNFAELAANGAKEQLLVWTLLQTLPISISYLPLHDLIHVFCLFTKFEMINNKNPGYA